MENTETIKDTQWKGNLADYAENEDDKSIVVEAPIFIIFAEYLGYVSRFNKTALDWCDGKIPDPHIQKIMMVEAKSIFRQMKKDYTIQTIKYWYDTYYPVIICEFVDKLANIIKKKD